ncbi:putative alpha-(1-2)-phosphatidylinositol pentamannoside mannosyltransferase [Mycobacterium xenopi 3993]|nr:putative alpha-(1-2)-phosphatidylinositol pentamannoside mannosyltransferase [Mycobacterium xenopi 3993]
MVLVVELFGLLLSPISWTHHWVWLVPLMVWLFHGPLSERRGARILGWGWLALTIVGVPWLLSFAQPTIWQAGRPWYLAWGGLVYIVATLATLAWIALSGRRTVSSGPDNPVDVARHCYVVLGDAALGMRHQHESDCPPTNVNVRMVIFGLRVLGYPAHRVDAGHK